jgi:hypothetical protein
VSAKITHKRLWQLGREYARRAAPLIIEGARKQSYQLPCRGTAELFPVLRDVYVLLEREHGLPWDSLTTAKQDDFLTGFWNLLRQKGILE